MSYKAWLQKRADELAQMMYEVDFEELEHGEKAEVYRIAKEDYEDRLTDLLEREVK